MKTNNKRFLPASDFANCPDLPKRVYGTFKPTPSSFWSSFDLWALLTDGPCAIAEGLWALIKGLAAGFLRIAQVLLVVGFVVGFFKCFGLLLGSIIVLWFL
jgi:hypothetical protein